MSEECVFKCGVPVEHGEGLSVEMNVDSEGHFHANQDHLNHAERVRGAAHLKCYAAWYEETYKAPFTMSG